MDRGRQRARGGGAGGIHADDYTCAQVKGVKEETRELFLA